jgi:hypothetical protein
MLTGGKVEALMVGICEEMSEATGAKKEKKKRREEVEGEKKE